MTEDFSDVNNNFHYIFKLLSPKQNRYQVLGEDYFIMQGRKYEIILTGQITLIEFGEYIVEIDIDNKPTYRSPVFLLIEGKRP